MLAQNGFWRFLLGDRQGNILPLAAIGMLVSAALVGGGIDLSRAYRAENRLQAACDAAVLAGRKAVSTNGFDSTAETQADNYFTTNFNEANQEAHDTLFEASSSDNGATVVGTASTTVDTAVMQIFGFTEYNLSVSCSASMGMGNSDVVMVLDNTGSMGWDLAGTSDSRIEALQDSMKNFYDTLSAATAGTSARIRYGFVPYSSSVNVGHLLYALDPDYLVDTYTYQSREAQWKTIEEQEFSHWDDPAYSNDTGYDDYNYGSWYYYSPTTRYYYNSTCEDNLPDDTGWQNNGSPTTSTTTYTNSSGQQVTRTRTVQEQIYTDYECYRYSDYRYYRIYRQISRDYEQNNYAIRDPVYTTTTRVEFDRWEYKPVTYDVSAYKTFAAVQTNTVSNGALKTSTWEGCIEERSTVSDSDFSYSSLTGMSPSGATDLDLDSAPITSNNATKWAPMWPEVAYRRWNDSGYYTTSTTNNGGSASSYCPAKSQLLAAMSESEFDAYADSLTPQGSTYLDIGMIWGGRLSSPEGIFASNVNEDPPNGAEVSRHLIFMTDGEMDTSYTIQSSYGLEYWDRRITDNGYSYQDDRHKARFLAVCEAIKAKGIRIWVIAFTASLGSHLTTCASDSSSFTADSAEELNAAFQDIANQVGELRVIQ